jgi:hypothetical protein
MEQIALTDTRTLICIVPFISLFHELEEWNILKWHRKVNIGVPTVSNLHVRITLIFVVILNFIWTGISLIPKSEIVTAYIIMPLFAAGIMNGIQHFIWLFKFKGYAPGVVFGFFLGVPVLLYIVIRILNENFISPWYTIGCGILVFWGIIHTIRLGAKMDPMIGKAMIFGSSISSLILRK